MDSCRAAFVRGMLDAMFEGMTKLDQSCPFHIESDAWWEGCQCYLDQSRGASQ
ncbi:hypothetical protein BTI_1580 [Burkholderia thailandensis MSMB121]|nr:hypothetical protein BTI_1580 [Burkholderia thailandensis MSMB121]